MGITITTLGQSGTLSVSIIALQMLDPHLKDSPPILQMFRLQHVMYGSLFWTKIGHLDSQCIWYRTVLFWSAYLGFPSKMDRGSIIMDCVFWIDYFGSIIMDRVFWIDYFGFWSWRGVVARSQSLLRGGRLK